jgi:hypothetical protein
MSRCSVRRLWLRTLRSSPRWILRPVVSPRSRSSAGRRGSVKGTLWAKQSLLSIVIPDKDEAGKKKGSQFVKRPRPTEESREAYKKKIVNAINRVSPNTVSDKASIAQYIAEYTEKGISLLDALKHQLFWRDTEAEDFDGEQSLAWNKFGWEMKKDPETWLAESGIRDFDGLFEALLDMVLETAKPLAIRDDDAEDDGDSARKPTCSLRVHFYDFKARLINIHGVPRAFLRIFYGDVLKAPEDLENMSQANLPGGTFTNGWLSFGFSYFNNAQGGQGVSIQVKIHMVQELLGRPPRAEGDDGMPMLLGDETQIIVPSAADDNGEGVDLAAAMGGAE